MNNTYSFKFVDTKLNDSLVSLLKRHDIKHRVGKNGAIHYSPDDEEIVENELIRQVRDRIFSPWQIISCPSDWAERYKVYMIKRSVPFVEELIDNQLCFLIPRSYHPHAWRI